MASKDVGLGSFATAQEAALSVARSPEGQAAAARAAAAAPLTSQEARQQAQAEKLTLLVADNKAGYFGVRLDKPGLIEGENANRHDNGCLSPGELQLLATNF